MIPEAEQNPEKTWQQTTDPVKKPGFRLDRMLGFLVVSTLLGIQIGFAIIDSEYSHRFPLMVTREFFWRVIFTMSLASAIGLGVGLLLDACITVRTKRFNWLVRMWILTAICTLLLPALHRAY